MGEFMAPLMDVLISLRLSGGKNELSDRAALSQSATDQSVRCLLETQRKSHPIVLLADNNYGKFPYDLKQRGYGYVVLGAYLITDAWRGFLLHSPCLDVDLFWLSYSPTTGLRRCERREVAVRLSLVLQSRGPVVGPGRELE